MRLSLLGGWYLESSSGIETFRDQKYCYISSTLVDPIFETYSSRTLMDVCVEN